MSYIQQTLSKDEQIKETAKLHWINYSVVVLCLILSLCTLVLLVKYSENNKLVAGIIFGIPTSIFFLSAIVAYLRILTIEMAITTKRVVCRTGVVSVHTDELKIARIESVEIKQSILGRILGYGSLWFSGVGTSKVLFPNIKDPRGVKARMEEVIKD